MTTAVSDRAPEEGSPSPHTLLISETVRQARGGAAGWVERELARGTKVYYKGWLEDGLRPEQHWIAGPDGARGARTAFATGQLEFMDFPTVVERAHGNAEGLYTLLSDEVERALAADYPAVAMTQESFRRPMADDDEVAEFARQEACFDRLAVSHPLRVLCQLSVPTENDAAIWESVALHHREVVDGAWSAVRTEGRWRLQGDLDAHVARRFGAGVHGALRAARERADGPDLHLDLTAVEFIDVACAQMLMLAVRSALEDQHVVVHGASRFQWHLFDAVGCAPRLRAAAGTG